MTFKILRLSISVLSTSPQSFGRRRGEVRLGVSKWTSVLFLSIVLNCVFRKLIKVYWKELIAGFPIQGSRVQNRWVAPRSTQPFIFPRSIKWVPGISRNWVVKSKLPPRSGASLELVEFYPQEGAIKFFFSFLRVTTPCIFFPPISCQAPLFWNISNFPIKDQPSSAKMFL